MLDEKLLVELQEYVDTQLNLVVMYQIDSSILTNRKVHKSAHHIELNEFINITREPTFSQVLFSFIDERGVADSDIYKKAEIDRRHFSKIRSNPDYRPGKNSVIALALALELSKKETNKLLQAAGYSLSASDTFDLVIQFCLSKKIYDIPSVNHALYSLNLKPLAGVSE